MCPTQQLSNKETPDEEPLESIDRRRRGADARHRRRTGRDGTVEDLLKPENKAKLVSILTYHVVSGSVSSAQVVKMTSAKTVEGQSVRISTKDGGVMIDSAHVVKADVMASNGVIHVIDSVILPQ